MSHSFFLLGHPVGHSVSPEIHRAAYESLGLVAKYGLWDCPDRAAVEEAVARIRSGVWSGANVTVPHKQLALELADRVDESAASVGASNVLGRDADGRLVAYNTDAGALAEELSEARKFAGLEGSKALVLGAGGAALAAVESCRRAGYREIFVSARRFSPEVPVAEWPLADRLTRLSARLVPWEALAASLPLAELGAVVQATSAGMKGHGGGDEVAAVVPWSRLPRVVAYDLVYNPTETPFLAAARGAGHVARGGLGMLVGQAALAIEIWLGQAPDRAVMLRAARHALGLGES